MSAQPPPKSNGISRAYSKAAEIGEPETPSTTEVDIKDDYEAKYGAVSAGNPKVFFKYFFVDTATGEKSGEMLASVTLASSNGENVPEENQNPGGNDEGGGSGPNPGGGSNY